MEELLVRATSLNGKSDFTAIESLFDFLETEEILRRNQSQIDSALNQLDVSKQTLTFLLLL